MRLRSLTFRILTTALATAAGCAAPGTGPGGARTSREAVLLDATREPIHAEWSPDTGRMSEALIRRHLPARSRDAILYAESFERPDATSLVGWRRIGQPQLKSCRLETRAGVEIVAPAGHTSDCGLERDLEAEKLSGRDVRIRLMLASNSNARLRALHGVRLSIDTTDGAGRSRELFLPITTDLSGDWENLTWWVRFGAQVSKPTLRLRLIQPGAGIAITRIEMSGRDWLPGETTGATRQTDKPANLIAGGDFETGRRMFYASLVRRRANGDQSATPLPFTLDGEAVVGERSLRLRIGDGIGRLGFGPLEWSARRANAAGPTAWHLKFYARGSRAATLVVSLNTRGRTLDRSTFALSGDWQAYVAEMKVPPDAAADGAGLGAGELVFDVSNEGASERLDVLLDGVSLTDVPLNSYVPAEPIEVGITGPAPLTADVADVVSETDATTFQVDLAASLPGSAAASKPAAPAVPSPAGRLAIDIVDGWDRLVWTRTTDVALAPNGRHTDKISLPLARGYYRMLATLWSGEPGSSQRISHDEHAVAVVSFQDPVPLGNRFGLNTADGCVSGYTTALGAGWVRIDLASQQIETKPGAWDFTAWQEQLKAAKQANVEVVAGLTLPLAERFRRGFLEQWLASNTVPPIGLVVSPPAISTRPADEYLDQLEWVGQMLAKSLPQTRLVCDLSATGNAPERAAELPRLGNLVVGYASIDTGIPESSDHLLEQIGRVYAGGARVWDLGVPVRLGGVRGGTEWPALAGTTSGAAESPVQLEADPVLSASRMVRAILVRALAGAQLVCCDASALSASASLYEDTTSRLHELDLTPRPAMAAFEIMTSLLNDATLVRWVDQADGSRILEFEKDSGGAVAVVWRPFGSSLSYIGLAGLPATMPVLDCLGNPELAMSEGHVRIVPVNEMVRYIVATPSQAGLLAEAVSAAKLRSGPTPATSQAGP